MALQSVTTAVTVSTTLLKSTKRLESPTKLSPSKTLKQVASQTRKDPSETLREQVFFSFIIFAKLLGNA